MSNQQTMTDYLKVFINGLISSGVEQAVISPGSRSTPLALLLHRTEEIQIFVEVDERSAGFFALGLSKVSQKPVVLLCTSGTAAANYYPAICEAKASHISLIVLTTDRPHELRQTGAPQSMDQSDLFRNHVKIFVEMALPESSHQLLDYVYWQGVRTVDIAKQTPQGPVHLNFPLREPLLPSSFNKAVPTRKTNVIKGERQLSHQQIKEILINWQGKRGILVVGGGHQVAEAKVLVQLAEKLQWPIIGDPLDNLRGEESSSLVMSQIDLFIDNVSNDAVPEILVRFGKLPLSKNFMLWLEQLKQRETSIYYVDEMGEWQDPLKQGQIVIQTEENWFVKELLQNSTKQAPSHWSQQWIKWQETAESILIEMSELEMLHEISASRRVHEKMVSSGQLFVSNSNGIRFIDRFAGKKQSNYQLYGNRGINGIDGIVSTALGMCAINPDVQNVLLIGDLALYHDMNGLLLAKKYQLPLTIVLLNNNGGGIFSFLSQRQLEEDEFELLFGTPIDLDFSLIAELYGAKYVKAENLEQLSSVLEATQRQPVFQLIEVVGDRQKNVLLHEEIRALIDKKIRGDKHENNN